MWSASRACLRPNVYARIAEPARPLREGMSEVRPHILHELTWEDSEGDLRVIML